MQDADDGRDVPADGEVDIANTRARVGGLAEIERRAIGERAGAYSELYDDLRARLEAADSLR